MNFAEAMPIYQARINTVLDQYLPPPKTFPALLHEAMRYAVLAGGKRIRAMCVYFTGEPLGAEKELLDAAAAAVELIHAYSLIHDDLPAMDDDDLRHGKPSCHKVFGEANAILAGDALQSLAFNILSHSVASKNSPQSLQMIKVLATGSLQMARGQVADLAAEGKQLTIASLEEIYNLKTSALIVASIQMGAIAAGADQKILNHLQIFGQQIGLAFQIQDDVIDIESSTMLLGKTQGADITKQKATFPALLGMKEAKEQVERNFQRAIENLNVLNKNFDLLKALALFIVKRNY